MFNQSTGIEIDRVARARSRHEEEEGEEGEEGERTTHWRRIFVVGRFTNWFARQTNRGERRLSPFHDLPFRLHASRDPGGKFSILRRIRCTAASSANRGQHPPLAASD